jgi:hypothetical protein
MLQNIVNSWCAIPNNKHKLGQVTPFFSALIRFYDELFFMGLAKKAKVTSRKSLCGAALNGCMCPINAIKMYFIGSVKWWLAVV